MKPTCSLTNRLCIEGCILLAGAGMGKTALLDRLLEDIPAHKRLISINDSPEGNSCRP